MDFETGKPPNRHTIAMGELIRKARRQARKAGMKQSDIKKAVAEVRLRQ